MARKKLTEAQVEALDRDDDGFAGGSRPKVGVHEFAAICAEAFESYEYQDERTRFDSAGRKWTFRPDKVPPGHSVLELIVERLDKRERDTIATSILASDMGKDMTTSVVTKLAEKLA